MTSRRIPGATRPAEVAFTYAGTPQRAPVGEALATALACAGVLGLRRSPAAGTPRGAFCFMGSCQECLVLVDGVPRQACLVPVRPGLDVQPVPDAMP
ncbi:(2Fe-2S)-binding protein [Roseomonas aerophila]|uniref:(2Fe-2S)-binding protein n=1 Tax=Teichococcus aerophilus TaxID=1224513 RepID=A0ABR7RN51_9PROT|nr:(2Fe-2S)-binding protein [Pseudoroseomonas aerophila]MBC9207992.1 (2Fe-2S)-binding protein [Pseudoroseomonas aerophila]